MSNNRLRLWLGVIALVALAGAFAYRSSVLREPPVPPNPRIVFVTGGTGPFWQLAIDGAKAAAKDYNTKLQVESPEGDENLDGQIVILTHLDLGQLDGVALSPLDAEGQTHLINRLAHEKKVVTFDSDAPLSDRQSYIGTSNLAAGVLCGKLVREALPKGGGIVVLLSNLTKENMKDRQNGFQENLGPNLVAAGSDRPSPNYEVFDYLIDNGDDEKCAGNIRDALKKHPDLSCIVGMNAHHGPVLLSVLKDAGKLGKIKLVTFDDDEATLHGIEEGYVFATVAQDPYKYGYEAVNTLASLCRGGGNSLPVVGSGSVYIGADAIRSDNLKEYESRVKKRQDAAQAASTEK
jgi:ribose transport system substrate-binding protein